MDNRKVGKLIADLRKKNGLTQQELGDKVGVGFRAVSKWERGITLPDITIINELSKILGISSNELLDGKVTKEIKTKSKISKKLKIVLSISISIIAIFLITFLYNYNKTYTYELSTTNNDSYIEGQVIIHKENIKIIINKLAFTDKELLNTEIENYEYRLLSRDTLIIGYGNTKVNTKFETIKTVKEFTEIFNINYDGGLPDEVKEIIKNDLTLNITFETKKREIIDKTIVLNLALKENKKA